MNILGLLFDSIHYLIGIIIVCLIICIILKVHNYYSKDNIIIPVSRISSMPMPTPTPTSTSAPNIKR